ncbi:MAG: ATP-binding protein [Myxococcota bacterium]
MSDRSDHPFPPEDWERLRREALERLRGRRQPLSRLTGEDLEALVHELEIHHVELEVQNEELRRAQADLAEARDRYRDLYELAPVGYLTLDEQGVIVRANQAMSKLCGVETGDLLGRRIESLLVASSRDDCYRLLRQATGDGAPRDLELQLETPGGDTPAGEARWAHVVVAPSTPGGFRVALTDVTERKKAIEDRLELARHRRVLQERMLEQLGALAGGLAHDFNNLLQTVLGNVQLVLDEQPEDSRWRPGLEDAAAAAREGGELTYLMLAYAGKASSRPLSLDLGEVVHGLIPVLESGAPDVDLVLERARDLPPIDADLGQLQMVVLNLVSNASEATPEGGTVRIRTGTKRLSAEEPEQAVGGQAEPGEYVFLSVHDAGAGMAPEIRRRMFEPFFSTKTQQRGLGLAAVLGIVRKHGGDILVDTRPGDGTTVTVLFPLGRRRDREGPGPAAEETKRGSGLVVVADDEPTIRDIAKAMLESAGFSVRTAADGAEALDLVRRHRSEVACVLVDYFMPRMNGLEVIEAVRAMDPAPPVLLMSGYTREEVLSSDAMDDVPFLPKPFTARQLRDAVLRRARRPGAEPGAIST